jgi:DNA-binding CsgD family transcriptional regulator/tetratricopeptide (TPR) repeat protein
VPDLGVTEDRTALLEREPQLAALDAALATVARRSEGGLALVAGEAGAGKTELLRRFCRQAESARVLWAACDALATPRPLGPLLDIAEATGGELEGHVAAGALPHDVAAALRRELAFPAPTVMVLEDAHWADEATLDVVRLVARRLAAVPALLVVSYRDEQVDRMHPLRLLLGELPPNGAVSRLAVPALSRAAVAALAEPAGIDPDELHARTGGNPFFVTEVLAAETDRIPDTVRDAVLARAARLSPPARALLDTVAIVPQRADLWLLDALGEPQPGALDECLRAGILTADGAAVAFRHELARVAVEGSLPLDRSVAMHRTAVAALAQPPAGAPDFARLAHHADAAGDAPGVLRFAPAAAAHAAALGAHREAEAQYARALRYANGAEPDVRADLLEAFAGECYLTDMRTAGMDALAEAIAIHRAGGDGRRLADALEQRSRLLSCAGRTAEASADLDEAVRALGDLPADAERAKVYSGLAGAAMYGDDHEGAIVWGARAIPLAERVGDTGTLARTLNYVGTVELLRGAESGREKLERSLALARDAGIAPEAGRAYINLVAGCVRICDWERVDGYIERGIEYCRELGLEAWEACLLAGKAESDLVKGRWKRAGETAAVVLERPKDHAGPRFDALRVLGLVRARRGDPERWPPLDEALDLARAAGDLQFIAPVAAARAEAAWLEGRPEAIERETTDALALAVERGDGWLACELVAWRRRAGLAGDLPGELHVGPYALELTGDHRGAADAWRALGATYAAAVTLADGDDEPSLREAHEALRALGARPAAAIVARRLRSRGARNVPRGPRVRTRDNAAGLTPRELEVLSLLADGLRNAEISARLVVSQKTVDHHVSAILRKLGVSNRSQAGTQAIRRGLLERAER